jgi:hypothetical protein
MKNAFSISIISIVIILLFSSCKKDDPEIIGSDDLKGKYEIYIDGSLYAQGSTDAVGLMQDNEQVYINSVTIGDETIAIGVFQFSKEIGGVVEMDTDSDPGVTVLKGGVFYGTISGSLTRESGSKISFEGKCTKLLDTEEHTISGYVESDLWEVIK